MTQNQINFAKLKEEIRHNQETEGLSYSSLAESARHNKINESIGWYTGAASVREAEARASYTEKQDQAYYANLVANSKHPYALLSYLIAQGFVTGHEEWVQRIQNQLDDDMSNREGDYYTNPNQYQK